MSWCLSKIRNQRKCRRMRSSNRLKLTCSHSDQHSPEAISVRESLTRNRPGTTRLVRLCLAILIAITTQDTKPQRDLCRGTRWKHCRTPVHGPLATPLLWFCTKVAIVKHVYLCIIIRRSVACSSGQTSLSWNCSSTHGPALAPRRL